MMNGLAPDIIFCCSTPISFVFVLVYCCVASLFLPRVPLAQDSPLRPPRRRQHSPRHPDHDDAAKTPPRISIRPPYALSFGFATNLLVSPRILPSPPAQRNRNNATAHQKTDPLTYLLLPESPLGRFGEEQTQKGFLGEEHKGRRPGSGWLIVVCINFVSLLPSIHQQGGAMDPRLLTTKSKPQRPIFLLPVVHLLHHRSCKKEQPPTRRRTTELHSNFRVPDANPYFPLRTSGFASASRRL